MARTGIVALASVAMALAGCGGGSGTGPGAGDPAIAVAFDPAAIDAYARQGLSTQITIRASVSPEPTAYVYPVLAADSALLETGSSTVTRNADGTYGTTLYTAHTLSLGAHEGMLTLRLCKDSLCTAEYAVTGGTLPLKVTVIPPVHLDVTVAGVPVTPPPYQTMDAYSVQAGQVVTVTANVPVTFTQGSSWVADIVPSSVTDTTWTGTIEGNSGHWVGMMARSTQVQGNSVQILFNLQ